MSSGALGVRRNLGCHLEISREIIMLASTRLLDVSGTEIRHQNQPLMRCACDSKDLVNAGTNYLPPVVSGFLSYQPKIGPLSTAGQIWL